MCSIVSIVVKKCGKQLSRTAFFWVADFYYFYLKSMRGAKKIGLLLFIGFCICCSAGAQTTQSRPQLMNLDQLFAALQKKFGVVCSYDKDLVKDVPVYADTLENNLGSLLEKLSQHSAFVFDHPDKKNIIVRPKVANANFQLSGQLTDSKTNEPLYSTIIYSRKSNFSLSSSENGSFYKIINYHTDDTVIISSVGYETMRIPLEDFAVNGFKTIKLKNTIVEMNEVYVTAYLTKGIEYDAMDNSITIRSRKSGVLPGQADGDVLKALDALPGISSPDSKAGNLNVRGSTPDQTLIVFDNIPLYHKGHFFGTISPFNSNVVDNIKVQRGTMSANRGGRTGGIIEISTAGSVTNKTNVTLSASMLDANVYAHVPLIKNKLSFLVSARQSYPYSWQLPAIKPISDFIFQHTEISGALKNNPEGIDKLDYLYSDANAKILYNINAKHKASLSGLLMRNSMVAGFRDYKTLIHKNSDLGLLNWGVNGSVVSDWTKNFSTNVSVTNSIYDQTFKSNSTSASSVNVSSSLYQNIVQDFRSFLETEWRATKRYALKSGYEGRYHRSTYLRQTDDTANTSFQENFVREGTIHTLFANLIATPTNRFILNAGARLNYFTLSKKTSVEPRVSVGYKVSEHLRLKSAAGYQQQFICQVSGISIEGIGGIENLLWILADDKNIPVVNSYQGTFGGIFEKKSWLFDVEAYYKKTDHISSTSTTQPSSDKPFIYGKIETVGADMLLRKQWKNTDAWISYTISKAMMQFDSISKDPFYSLYDQTHIVDIACSHKIKQWKFTLAWKYRTGFAALPGIRTKMMAGANSAPGGNNQPPPPPPGGGPPPPPGQGPPPPPPGSGSDRFPAYHSLDASIQYGFPKTEKNWKGSIGLSLLNCYNQKNITDSSPIMNNGINNLSNRYMTGFMPNVVVKFTL
ncbi:MAG: TonB-dependent receptor [Bacteroidia bacterium]|nr:TonB-dependent receptor [Bacteroidia bacterium]